MRILHAAAIVSTLLGMGACSFIYPGDNLVGSGPDGGSSEAGTNEGGTDADPDASTDVFVDGIPGVSSIDATLTHVYWCNTADGTVARRRTDGSATEIVVSKESAPKLVAVSSAHVYWTTGKNIRRASLDGKNVETYVTATEEPSGLAFDRGSTPALLWSERAAGKIKSRSGDAGELTLRDTVQSPGRLAVESSSLYVVLGSGELISFNNFGGGIIRVEGADTSDVEVTPSAVFFSKPSGAIARRELGGEQKTSAIVLDAKAPASVATDGAWIYWAEPSESRIRRRKL